MANLFKTHPRALKIQRLYNENSTISGVPYVFLYYYVPVKYQHDKEYSFTKEVETSCHKIWNFKDGIDQEWAIDAVTEVLDLRLYSYNGKSNPKLTFVCIPASTIDSNNQRFKYFSAAICERLYLNNGFDHIKIVKEKTPKHISGVESESELEIDPFFFAGKDIILFDDVVTKGHSMQKLMQKLQAVNAKTVLCLSLGKTYFPPVTTINPINPYTGNHLLVAPQEQTDDCITIDTTKPALPSRSAYSSDIYGTANSSTSASAFGSTSKPNAGSAFGSVSSSVHVDINKNTGYQLYENREQNGAKILKELQSLNDDKEVIKRIKSLNDNELKTVLHYINENESNTKSNYNSDNRITYTIDSSSKGSGSYISGNSIKGSGSYTNSGSDDDSGSYTSSGSGNNSGCVVIIILIILFIFVF